MSQSQTDDEYGFAPIPAWLLRGNYFESAGQISLYVALVCRRDQYGYCHSSLSLLAHDAMISRKSVINNLKRLEDMGLITRHRRTAEDGGHLSNEYSVPLYPTKKRKGM